jgi:hypothetical protein
MNTRLPLTGEVDELSAECAKLFGRMVDSVGVKRFSEAMCLSTRQVNRMLSGAQPNPVERLIRCLQSCDPAIGDELLDFLGQEMGGYFIREEPIEDASVNAVRECAEAIAAISDGYVSGIDEREIREAIAALIALSKVIKETGRRDYPPLESE